MLKNAGVLPKKHNFLVIFHEPLTSSSILRPQILERLDASRVVGNPLVAPSSDEGDVRLDV